MGQFQPGAQSKGGKTRAARLSPERRREIAMQGLQALADKLFDGDVVAAQAYITERARLAKKAAAAARRAAREGGGHEQ